jgi:hypothetical protein
MAKFSRIRSPGVLLFGVGRDRAAGTKQLGLARMSASGIGLNNVG